jgi:DNA-binding XRE family transcriptional regulator
MAKTENKTYSLAEMKDKYIGKIGTTDRNEYEYELRMDVLGRMIKTARQERNLTQEQLGELVGVKKSQISKLESSTNSATIDKTSLNKGRTHNKGFCASRADRILFSNLLDLRSITEILINF